MKGGKIKEDHMKQRKNDEVQMIFKGVKGKEMGERERTRKGHQSMHCVTRQPDIPAYRCQLSCRSYCGLCLKASIQHNVNYTHT